MACEAEGVVSPLSEISISSPPAHQALLHTAPKRHQTSTSKKQLICIYNMCGVIGQVQCCCCVLSNRKDI